jgi:rhomboid-like protein
MLLDSKIDLTNKLAMWPIIPGQLRDLLVSEQVLSPTQKFLPYQVFTHMFSHGGISHILFNMFGLFMFGRILENFWGGKKFLLFYLLCGVGAAACHLGVQYFRSEQLLQAVLANNGSDITKLSHALAPAVGASGAIMGVLAGFAYLFPNTELYIMFIPIPVKAKWAVLGMTAIDLFGGVANMSGDNIAHFAHLGGAIVGFLLVYYWNKTNRKTFY